MEIELDVALLEGLHYRQVEKSTIMKYALAFTIWSRFTKKRAKEVHIVGRSGHRLDDEQQEALRSQHEKVRV